MNSLPWGAFCHQDMSILFLKITIHASVLHRIPDLATPWPKLSKKPHRPAAPASTVEPARGIAPRRKTADQRLRILERLSTGLSIVHIARVEKLKVRRVQQIIAAMLESREIDPPAGFVQLQVARLSQADDRHTDDDDGGRSSGGRQNDPAHALHR
jgi:hypothetical protein